MAVNIISLIMSGSQCKCKRQPTISGTPATSDADIDISPSQALSAPASPKLANKKLKFEKWFNADSTSDEDILGMLACLF